MRADAHTNGVTTTDSRGDTKADVSKYISPNATPVSESIMAADWTPLGGAIDVAICESHSSSIADTNGAVSSAIPTPNASTNRAAFVRTDVEPDVEAFCCSFIKALRVANYRSQY